MSAQVTWFVDPDEPTISYGFPPGWRPVYGEQVRAEEPIEPIAEQADLPAEATALYRFYDAEDRLLYIGITGNPHTRWADHAKRKRWWPLVVRREVVWYKSRQEAHAAEVTAIGTERPLHNGAHMAPGTKISTY